MEKEMSKKNLREQIRLEGAIGYITHLSNQIEKEKIKTIEQLSEKLDNDGKRASGALALHLEKTLKIVGFNTGFPKTVAAKSN